MADYEAHPEGGIVEKGQVPAAAPEEKVEAPAEEVKTEAAPEPTVEPEVKPEGNEAPAKDEPEEKDGE